MATRWRGELLGHFHRKRCRILGRNRAYLTTVIYNRKRRRELRQQKIQEEVQRVVLHMHAEQEYPSFNQVLKRVDRFCICPPIFDLEAYIPWRKLLDDLDYGR
jgi:hypothetical protein